jgi:hypothetical protein
MPLWQSGKGVPGEWASLRIPLPLGWNDRLIAALYLPNCPLDAAQMQLLGEAELDSLAFELAYAISAVGLAKGQANARFLFLSARCFPPFAALRRNGCFAAALELARRERNTELVGKILDRLRGNRSNTKARSGYGWSVGDDPGIASRPVSPELLSQILEEEKTLEQFPIYEGHRRPKYAPEFDVSLCDCPKCRARRGEAGDDEDEDDFDTDDEFDDEGDFDEAPPPSLKQMAEMLDEVLGSLHPAMAQAVAQLLKEEMAAGEDPFTALDKIVGKGTFQPEQPVRSRKTDQAPPEQGSLF